MFISLEVKSISLLKIAMMRAAASLTAWIALSMVRGSGCARELRSAPPTRRFRRVETMPTKKKGGRKGTKKAAKRTTKRRGSKK
jgi:hypothetical protein